MRLPLTRFATTSALSAALLLCCGVVAQGQEKDKPQTFTTRSIIQLLKPKEEHPPLGGFRGVVIIPPKAQQDTQKEAAEEKKQDMQEAVKEDPTTTVKPVAVSKPTEVVKPVPVVEAPPPSINMSVQFEFGSAKLTKDAITVLSNLGEALRSKELADYSFLLAGHTDAVGSNAYNKRLSMLRAASVKDHLIKEFGINGNRLSSIGKGEEDLLDARQPESGVNRRVQITNLGRSK